MSEGYIKSLDGVRALAILLVMAFHAGLIGFGWMGVQLFFVLSGFLITGILWKEKAKGGTVGRKLKKFWVRRSLRIFPLYFGYLAFLGIAYLLTGFPDYYEKYIPYLATYSFNFTRLLPGWEGNPLFTHLWSLSIEEQFYLLFPLLVFLLPRRVLPLLMVAVIIISPVVRMLLYQSFIDGGHAPAVAADAVYWHTAAHLDAFFMGGLIPVAGLAERRKLAGNLAWITGSAVLAAGVLRHMLYGGEGAFFFNWGYEHAAAAGAAPVWIYTLLNLFFAALILFLLSRRSSLLSNWLQRNWLVRIGRVSYGMYVFHWAILVYAVARLYPSDAPYWKWIFFPLYAAAVYGFAALSYRFYESWFLMLKDKWYGSHREVAGEAPGVMELKLSGKRD